MKIKKYVPLRVDSIYEEGDLLVVDFIVREEVSRWWWPTIKTQVELRLYRKPKETIRYFKDLETGQEIRDSAFCYFYEAYQVRASLDFERSKL